MRTLRTASKVNVTILCHLGGGKSISGAATHAVPPASIERAGPRLACGPWHKLS
jgi:hypothetical protein